MSGGKSSSDSQSMSKQGVWAPQGDILEQMYGYAPDLLSNVQNQMPGLQQGMADWTNNIQGQSAPAWEQQMQGGNLAGYDPTGALAGSIKGAMGNPTQQQQAVGGMQQFDQGDIFQRGDGSNYTDAYRQTFIDDARGATDNMLSSLDARSAASGMGGGSAYGNAMARGMQDINSNMQSNLANIGYQDYNNQQNQRFQDRTNRQNRDYADQSRLQGMQQQAGAAADQNLLAQQGMLGNLSGQQNANMQQALAQTGAMNQLGQADMQNAMMPTNAYSQLMQAMGGPTVLSDSWSISDQSSKQGGI